MRVLSIVGARPNFVKIAPLIDEMGRRPEHFQQLLVHTGQHYDEQMSQVFFDELDIPRPDVHLGVGSGSHAEQTARVMLAFEPVLLQNKPDLVLVVGDVNSTLACALVATKVGVPVAHVEAGLRSRDRTMPEEINRLLTDQVADLLFVTERDAVDNLRREGIGAERIHLVGNVMIDTLLRHRERALAMDTVGRYGLQPAKYALLTLHRPSNVDEPAVLAGIVDALEQIQERLPVLFCAHPRTARRMQESGLGDRLAGMPGLKVTEPLGYLEFLNLMSNARLVLSDSGGIQEETTILGVPCLTLRRNTERPVTVSEGTNTLVGTDPQRIVAESLRILSGENKAGRVPELWDGHAAERIVDVLATRGPHPA